MISTRTYHQLAAILLIAALFVQTFHNELIWVDYEFDTNSYAALCVNKAMPAMDCNGQCQMVKKMQHADDQSNQTAQIQSKTVDVVLYVEDVFRLEPLIPDLPEKIFPELPGAEVAGHSRSMFHPPIVA